jgi:hypothetical protein
MLRGDPPQRKTPLRAKKAWRPRPKATGPSQDAVEAVYERASWSCERCSGAVGPIRGVDHHVHHRRPRGNGGTVRPETNWPSNLLLLCPTCHEDGKTGVESRRKAALAAGWLVHQTEDPATVPVVIHGPRLVWLTVDGQYSDHPPRSR